MSLSVCFIDLSLRPYLVRERCVLGHNPDMPLQVGGKAAVKKSASDGALAPNVKPGERWGGIGLVLEVRSHPAHTCIYIYINISIYI